jgi:polyisoprenoid-binding protein YceI
MMVSQMRGLFKNVRGHVIFDPDDPAAPMSAEADFDAAAIWTGDNARDVHLRGADFLDVETHPLIRFTSNAIRKVGDADFVVTGELSLRGVVRPVTLEAHYLGNWQCPYWEGDRDLGPVSRIGFTATTTINRHDFGVAWNAPMDKGGVVVGETVAITLDVEAILESDMVRVSGA